jgi:hypothetical protein
VAGGPAGVRDRDPGDWYGDRAAVLAVGVWSGGVVLGSSSPALLRFRADHAKLEKGDFHRQTYSNPFFRRSGPLL